MGILQIIGIGSIVFLAWAVFALPIAVAVGKRLARETRDDSADYWDGDLP